MTSGPIAGTPGFFGWQSKSQLLLRRLQPLLSKTIRELEDFLSEANGDASYFADISMQSTKIEGDFLPKLVESISSLKKTCRLMEDLIALCEKWYKEVSLIV